MSTRKIVGEYRLRHWNEVMQERMNSGLSIKAYCANAGIHENVYYYWQRKLREAAIEISRMQDGASEIMPSGFTEVKIAERTHASVQAPPQHSRIRIEVNGIRIEASGAYPTEQLLILLREMRSPC